MTEELEKILSTPWDGPTEVKQGYTYLPWDHVMEELNKVFGWQNVNVEVVGRPILEKIMGMDNLGNAIKPCYGYSTHVRLSVIVDGKTVIRDGIGFNELTFTRASVDKDGNTVGGIPQIDVALKGSASNAIVRAAALLGTHFGLDLYHKDSPESNTELSPTKSSSVDRRPSEKQLPFLLKSFTQAQVDAMPFAKWKDELDKIFAGKKTPVAAAASRKPADDYEF